ncbi:tetratricopeptide repeat protein 38-like [Mytilus californianus]|uniref:tetratricopeptide repeat protein 38-like n=1 Tax=Mytilus californianus TaxID=6549 RepID=UPI002245ACC8|nr:tetratricopeptide repeat protein 38-like [Mytilus californianus]
MMHSNWRGCKDWADFDIPLTTTSDEASKQFDAVLTQYVGWYEEDSVGGIDNSINKMIEADPEFVLGHVMKNGLELSSLCKNINANEELREDIKCMVDKATKQYITTREKKHVSAVKLWAEGDLTKACEVWEDILMEHPTDMLAVKFAHDCYYCLSHHHQMRDSIARILPFWNQSIPLYGYLLGMHAFGLEETCLYNEAKKQAERALEINRHDAWASHAMAHVYEMTGKYDEGIKFMSSTENDWKVCGMTSCHNYWHYGLFYIEKGEFDEALGLFDNEIGRRAFKSKSTMEIANSVSYLYRLRLEGVPVIEKFKDFNSLCTHHYDDHALGFLDTSYMMACLGANDMDSAKKLTDSIRKFLSDGKGNTCESMKSVGSDLCEALIAFEDGQFDKAVDIIYPKRYQIINLGGSNAQRDVINLFLIHAALKSEEKRHRNLAKMLIFERKSLKENSPLTDRLIAKLVTV